MPKNGAVSACLLQHYPKSAGQIAPLCLDRGFWACLTAPRVLFGCCEQLCLFWKGCPLKPTRSMPGSEGKASSDPAAPVSGEAEALRIRLEALKADLGGAKGEQGAQQMDKATASADGGAIGTGLRAGSELLAGVLVGCGIGYVLDRQLGTSPLFLIPFLLVGMAAGFWNIYRLAAHPRSTARSKDPGQKREN